MEKLALSVCEAADALGISRGKAYEQVRMGRLASIRLGRRILIPREAVLELLGTRPKDSFNRGPNPIPLQPRSMRWTRIIDELIEFLRSVREEIPDQ